MNLPGSAYQLALLRILFGIQILFSSSSEAFNFLQLVPGTNYTKTIFTGPIQDFINQHMVNSLQLIVQITSIFMIIGFLTRYIMPILTLSFIVLFSFFYSRFDAPVPWLYLWFPLIVFSFSDVSKVWSVDSLIFKTNQSYDLTSSKFRWPVELLAGWWAYIYFAAGLAKLFPLHKGISWLEGGTSHQIMYDRYLDSVLHYIFGKPIFDYSESGFLFMILTIGALFIELCCALIYFTNKYNIVILCFVLSMHTFLFLTGVPGFGILSFILGISLLTPNIFLGKIKH